MPLNCPSAAIPLTLQGFNPYHTFRMGTLYFNPQYEDFRPRTIWSLSNAFTSAFKALDPIPQFKATAKLGPYLERVSGS